MLYAEYARRLVWTGIDDSVWRGRRDGDVVELVCETGVRSGSGIQGGNVNDRGCGGWVAFGIEL